MKDPAGLQPTSPYPVQPLYLAPWCSCSCFSSSLPLHKFPTLGGKVLSIPEWESTEAGYIFRHHGPSLTQGHSSMTADMFDSGALYR